ncbi:MAG: hypothetical protein U5K51_05270 [Flavobacteriaceae bacterium]|nr:hypothetical protein [Flavobacteriaceae bacterium]
MNTLKIALIFFIVLTILSLLFNSFSDLVSMNLTAVMENNFYDGKWISFFGIKIIFSLVYGMWMTARNMK